MRHLISGYLRPRTQSSDFRFVFLRCLKFPNISEYFWITKNNLIFVNELKFSSLNIQSIWYSILIWKWSISTKINEEHMLLFRIIHGFRCIASLYLFSNVFMKVLEKMTKKLKKNLIKKSVFVWSLTVPLMLILGRNTILNIVSIALTIVTVVILVLLGVFNGKYFDWTMILIWV